MEDIIGERDASSSGTQQLYAMALTKKDAEQLVHHDQFLSLE